MIQYSQLDMGQERDRKIRKASSDRGIEKELKIVTELCRTYFGRKYHICNHKLLVQLLVKTEL